MIREVKVRQLLFAESRQHGGLTNMLHVVNVPPHARGGIYLQGRSIDGFRHRLMQHTQVWKHGEFVDYRNRDQIHYAPLDYPGVDVYNVYESFLEACEGFSINVYKHLPVTKHYTVWEFFKHINYDHQKRTLNGIHLQENKGWKR